jgi:hypothetical protein
MTIVEKNNMNSPWLFRTQPLQTNTAQTIPDVPYELTHAVTPAPVSVSHYPVVQQKQPQQQQSLLNQIAPAQSQEDQQPQQQQQRFQQSQNLRPRVTTGPIPIDPKKVAKSSTAPNLPTSNSLSEMFRVI